MLRNKLIYLKSRTLFGTFGAVLFADRIIGSRAGILDTGFNAP